MSDLTDDQVRALADAKPGNLFVDQDEDVCIDDGRQFNLIFCPARDDGPIEAGWAVLNPDVVAELVTRYNMAPDLARALLDARADAQAAVALVVERAVEAVEGIRVMFLMATPDDWDEGDNATFEFIKDQLRDLAPDADTAAIRRAAEETGT